MQIRTILYQYIRTLIKYVFLWNFTRHELLMILESLVEVIHTSKFKPGTVEVFL